MDKAPDSQTQTKDESVAQVLELAREFQAQRKAETRWKWGFRFALVGLLGVLMFQLSSPDPAGYAKYEQPHAALIRLQGPIMEGALANAESINDALRDAFHQSTVKGIVILANSPGGTPVQSALIYDEIRRLKAQYPDKKVMGVVGDLCASGCYYVLAAADEIYANSSSIVGSIGVRMESFGVGELMQKLGVEQRLLTAGEHKAMLNPFGPEDAVANARLTSILEQTHQEFIVAVKTGRHTRLSTQADLFSGLVWTGREAIALGLSDGLGDVGFVVRERLKLTQIIDYTFEPSWMDLLAKELGQGVTLGVLSTLEQKAATPLRWSY